MDPVVQILLEKLGPKMGFQQSYDYKQDMLLLRTQVTLQATAFLHPLADQQECDKGLEQVKTELAAHIVELVDECKTEARRRRDGR